MPSAVVDTVAADSHRRGPAPWRKPAIVQRALRRSRTGSGSWNEVARREQHRNQAQASALIPVIVQQVTENVIAQLDFVRIVEQIPIDDIAGAIDVEAIVQRIDLGGVIRESTMGLTTEAVDAVRSQGIALDGWVARVVDKVLFRKEPRDVDDRRCVVKGEIRNERSRAVQGHAPGSCRRRSAARSTRR